jgi:hypothetical protein
MPDTVTRVTVRRGHGSAWVLPVALLVAAAVCWAASRVWP